MHCVLSSRLAVPAAVALLASSGTSPRLGIGSEEVVSDPSLREVIAGELGREGFACADMESLSRLEARGKGIRSLAGLQCAKNLQALLLNGNRIEDLGPLRSLSRLEELDLSRNRIRDLGPLAGLNRLRDLSLEGNQIEQLGPLIENAGIGSGDVVRIACNRLVVKPGSRHEAELDALRDRGAAVVADPQPPDPRCVAPGG